MNKRHPQRPSRTRLAFETLEPRALLSADLLPVATLPEPTAPIAAEFREYVATDSTPVILAAAEPPRELVIIDGMVAEADRLAADWRNRGFEVVVLDAAKDAITQIDDLLATKTDLAAVHLVSHGIDGALQLGGTTFDAATLSTRSAEVARWSLAFAADGDLLLYGCDVAGDAWGGTFIDRLALLTGADVAASTDDTGSALLGGNWNLEYATGAIETHTLDAADWLHLLAPQTITWSTVAWTNGGLGPVNIAIGSLGNVVVTLSGDTAQLQSNSPNVGSNLQGGFGGSAGSSLNLDSNGGFASTQSVNVLFDFSALPGEVVNLSFYVFDIDIANSGSGFIDRVTLTANGGTLNPTTVTASGIDNFVSSANTITGKSGNSSNPSGDGNGFFAFSQRGLTSINLNYGNANASGQSTQGIGINTITFFIAPKNTAPATVTTPENTAFAFTGGNALSVSDDDATSVTLSVANGSLALTASGGATLGGSGGNRTITGTLAAINATLASLVYTPNAGYNGTDTLTFTSSDGTYTDTDTIAINVTPVNDVPVVGSLAGDARSYAAGSGAVVVDQGGNATVTDIDSANFSGGNLTVSIVSGGVAAEDVLGISSGTVTLSAGVTVGSTVSVGGVAIGTITSAGTSGASLTVALNASATPTRVQSLVRAVTYQDTSAINPTPGTRTIRFTVNDGDGGTSAAVDATVTVKPVVSIAATDSVAAEPANNGQFTVSLSAASATNTVIAYSIGGTAANGSDYGAMSGSVTILAGATSATINVSTIDDALVEPSETVVLTLTSITSGDSDIRIRSDANSATVNLADDDTAQVSVAATTAPAEPGTNGVFTVSMTKASSTNTVISYTIGGTATSGTDFTALSGSVTILAGNTTATVTVPVIDDLLVEANETVVLTLTGVAGDPDITINGAANTSTLTITDNDSAQVSIAATTAAAAEPATNGVFTVSMTRASSTDTVISYTVAGTATAGADYTALSGSVTILAGSTSATITVPVLNDALVEASETVVVTLTGVTGDADVTINGAANSATVTIADNDTAQVSVAATTAAAAEGGANGVFTVSLTNASSTDTTVSYTLSGTATSGSDYTALAGTVTITAGSTTATITVPVINDSLVEASETVILTLGSITAGDADISINGAANAATVTIADNDTAQISIAATTAAAAEGGANGVYTVTLTSASSTATVVSYTVAGSATSGSDYTALSGTVTIAAGATTATINVAVTNDALVEASETVIVTLASITSGDPDISINGAANSATVSIADNDTALVSIAATTSAAAEGGANGLYTLTLSNASSTATTVSYTVTGTAAAGSDYTALSGTVTIAAGATTATITVPVLDDALVEGSETVVVTLNAITAGDPDISIDGAANAATVTIGDNDTALVSIAATTNAAEPGTSGLFTVSLSGASSTPTTVSYTVGGTATEGSDYTALSGTVTIAAGATTATIAVPVLDDSLVEGSETVVVTLGSITSGDPDIAINGAANAATVTIADNDTAVVSIAATTAAAAEGGANGVYTVTLSTASATATTVSYTVSGTATSGSDFTALSGSVTIAAGATTATITVPVIDDALVEASETVVVTLGTVTAGDPGISVNGAANAATVTIADNDTALVSIAATTAAAAEGGANGVYTVTLSNASSTATIVSYTVSGTATSGSDFTALSGSVTILTGATTASITVPAIDDSLVESSETVVVTLGAVTAGDPDVSINGAANAATVTIADNDTALVSIAATTAAAVEGGANGVYTVSLSNASSTATTISYSVTGTAVSGSDFTALTGTVTIAAGATTATITVPVIDDSLVEASETVIVTLGTITSGDPDISINGAANAATVNIADNDAALVSIAATTAAAAEGGANGVYTVTLSNASSTATTVSYGVTGTAASDSDFTALSGTVTIAAGATTATITVPIIDDSLVEASETVVVTLGAITAGDPDISINGAANAATVTIADNDTALVSIAATTAAAAEGGANGVYTVSLSKAASTDTTVSYTVTGTAVAGSDFTALSGTVTIGAGATTATITVPVIDDSLVEASESVIVTLNTITAGDPDISINGAANAATVTIADNDTALVSIAATTAAAAEGGANGVYTVTLSNASSTATTVSYTVSGTAASGSDFTALSGSVTIAAGATTATITVSVIDDGLVEGSETVVVTLGAVTTGDPDISIDGAADTATVAIADNDTALVSIAATTAAAAEGGANGVYTVSLSNASSTDTTVSYAVTGTAASGSDFTALSGTVTLLAGATTATITVPVIDDSLVEASETVVVTLGAVTAGDPDISINGAANAATVTIADNDTALVSIAATTPAAAEGGANGVYTVSLTNAASTATTLSYTVTGSAAAGSDFTALSGTVTIAAGATTATITVPVIDDSLVEASESVIVTLTAVTSGDPDISIDGAANVATVTIADNDTALASIVATTAAAAEGGANGVYTISLTNAASTDTTVSYTVTGTAASGSDFTPLFGTVTILAGATTATITVPVIDDSLVEASESVIVTLNTITAGDPDTSIDGAANAATVTIADNDAALVSIATTANAAEPGANGLFTVSMTNASSTDTVVAFTVSGTAASGVDFTTLPISVTIVAGATTATIAVPVVDDSLVEATETVIATLTGVTSGDADIAVDGAASAATVAIADNDTALVAIAATAPNAAEGGAGGTFTVTLSNASSTDTVVSYVIGGTAAAGTDYAALSGTVTIVAGATSTTIPVVVTDDALVELTENVTVTLTGVAGDPDIAIDAGASAASVSIADNDTALVSIAATDPAAAEPANHGRFTVSMSAAASTDTVIAYTIGGTAAAGLDYTALSGTVTIVAGTTSAIVDVNVLNDLIVEGDETVVATLTAIAAGDADISIDGAANAATVTIADDDSALISIATTAAGAEPGTTGRFTITMSQASSTDTVIAYGIAGTALGGTDYAALSGTVTIAAGSTTAIIDVSVIDDALVEANETVVLTLASITSGDPDIAIDGAANAATVVITDNDTAQASIAATGAAAEPGTNGQFTVTLSAVSSTDTIVGYTVGGTAAAAADYAALSGTVTILAGSTTATIAVPVLDDSLVEATESVVVTLTGFVSADADISIDGAANVATVNIADDDNALVSIAATTPVAAEPGPSGRFTVWMSNASSTDTVIAYTIAGTAANGVDYVLLPGSVTILAGTMSATIDVGVIDDMIVEANEPVALTLTGIITGDLDISIDAAANTATVTITDNDTALVSIAATTPSAAEPGTNGQFTVSMSLAASTDTVITYTIGGTAVAGADYAALSGTVIILAGTTTATITVPVLDDAIVEGTETVVATLGPITAGDSDIGIDGTTNIATISVADNDAALASIAVTAAPAEPGTAGQLTVTLSNVSSTDTVLSYTVAGTAAPGTDYAALSGTVTIAAGSSSATIVLNVIDDALVEANETVIVTLTAVTSGDPDIAIDGAAASATATIADDDTALVSIAATTPAAGEGAANGRFTVSMSAAASTDTVIAYSIAGTAVNGTDYAPLSGSVTILAGSTSAFIDVAAVDDAIVEGGETVVLTLTAITSGDPDIAIDGAAAAATATIADNDSATLTVGDVTVNEAAGTISFSVTVDRAVQGGFTVDAMFAGGTATGGADYANAAQTLAFAGAAGETHVVTLAVVNDAVVEATETFGVSLANVTPATAPSGSIDATDTATGTILDNDVATLAIADVTASEAAGAVTFAVTVDLAVQGGFSVDAIFTDGSATGGVDYASALQTLNFAGTAGETVFVTVPVVNDALVEADETFTIGLANLAPATAPSGSIVITDTALGTIANDDHAPTVSDATVPLAENSAAGTTVIDLADAVTLGDADPDGDAITYSIIAGNGAGAFTINAATGVITVANPLPLDCETTPTFVLTVLASDGTNTDTATVTVDLLNVNEAPTATVPGAQTVAEDTPLTFSVGGGNGITVADVDATNLQVTLGATHGTLTLATLAGLTFTTGDGTADATMTFTGSLAAVNAALDGLVYAPAANYNGADNIAILFDDQGQSGLGGAQTFAASIPVTVTAVNDAPTLAGDLGLAVAEGNAVTIAAADLAGVDVDDAGAGLVYTLAGVPSHGQLEFGDAPGAAITTFTQADLDAGRVRYVHDGSETTADVFTVMLADGGEDGAAPAFATLNVAITPMNDAPRLVPGDGTVDAGGSLVLSTAQVSAVDPDNAADTLVYLVDGTSGGFIELVTASGVPIASFTGAQLASGLVRFVQSDASATSAGFSVHVSDGQAASSPSLVVLTMRATGGVPPLAVPSAPVPVEVMYQTSAVNESRSVELRGPQVAQFIRAPLFEEGGPVLAEPEPFVPPAPRMRVAASGAIETPSIEISSSGLRFEAPTLGETQIPRVEFSFQPVRYDLPGTEDAVPSTRSSIVEAVQITGLALTAGGVWWVLRFGSLIGSALVSAPAWRHIDPLPVLGGRDREDDVDWEGDKEPSESGEAAERFFDQASAKTAQV